MLKDPAVTSEEHLVTAGYFSDPGGALAFLGAAVGARLTASVRLRRSPEGPWWIEIPAAWQRAAHLIRAAGGRPFTKITEHWRAVPVSGEPSAMGRENDLDVATWMPVELVDLLAVTALRPARLPSVATLDVVVPGALGRWVLRRVLALNIKVGIVNVMRQSLRGNSQESGALSLRLTARRGSIPLSLLRALTSLPYTLVAQAVGPGTRRLLVDVRHRLPLLTEGWVADLVPQEQIWVLGGPDIGHWRLRLLGDEVDGSDFLEYPSLPVAAVVPNADGREPARIPIKLITRRESRARVDGLLVDESELNWLRPLLMARPADEPIFLLPGAGHHLVLAPGGLAGTLPLGIALDHLGPGGLYLEKGLAFYPPLPEVARQRLFQLTEQRVVAVVAKGAYGFDSRRMVPAWTLWIGEAPPVQEGLSPGGERLLARLSATVRQAVDKEMAALAEQQPAVIPKSSVTRRLRRLEEAQRAELEGDWVRAAELLEAAGELVRAARLYERAAAQMQDQS